MAVDSLRRVKRLAAIIALGLAVPGCGSDAKPAAEQTAAAPPAPTTQTATPATTTATAPPATAPEEPAGKSVPEIPQRDESAKQPWPEFYFYFAQEANARAAAADLQQHGYRVRTTAPEPDIKEWSVIGEGAPQTPDLAAADRAFEPWAKARDGRYDGNEVPVGP